MAIKDFAGTTPVFLPEDYFNGRLEAWGVIESLVGGLQRRCSIEAEGRWSAAEQTVHFTETYRYDDGQQDTLVWAIRKIEERRYEGSETRLSGKAEGDQAGCAFNWRYTRDTPQPGGKSSTLNFDDWFYRIDERVCIVRGSAGRAGLPFAIAHVTYRRLG